MPPASSSFTALNIEDDVVPEWMGSFTLAAPPNTDLWRKPPARDTSTAPILYTALRNPFIAAEVTVSADWELEWDQAGLVIFAGSPPGQMVTATAAVQDPPVAVVDLHLDEEEENQEEEDEDMDMEEVESRPSTLRLLSTDSIETTSTLDTTATATPTSPSLPPQSQLRTSSHLRSQSQSQPQPAELLTRAPPPPYVPPSPASKWVKVGLEFCNNACHATSVVANSEGADWSLSELPPSHATRSDLRVKFERIGYALWVWYEDTSADAGPSAVGHSWKKLREVTWFFWGVEDKAVRVGVYASRPANFGGNTMWERNGGRGRARNLCVDFEGLEIF